MTIDPRSLSIADDRPEAIVDVDGVVMVECQNHDLALVVLAALQDGDDNKRAFATLEQLVLALRSSTGAKLTLGHGASVALGVAERVLKTKKDRA